MMPQVTQGRPAHSVHSIDLFAKHSPWEII